MDFNCSCDVARFLPICISNVARTFDSLELRTNMPMRTQARLVATALQVFHCYSSHFDCVYESLFSNIKTLVKNLTESGNPVFPGLCEFELLASTDMLMVLMGDDLLASAIPYLRTHSRYISEYVPQVECNYNLTFEEQDLQLRSKSPNGCLCSAFLESLVSLENCHMMMEGPSGFHSYHYTFLPAA